MLAFKMLQELGFLEDTADKLACFGLDSPRASEQDRDTAELEQRHRELLGWAHELDLDSSLGFQHQQPVGQHESFHLQHQGQALAGAVALEHGQGKLGEYLSGQDSQRQFGADKRREQLRNVPSGTRGGGAGGQEGGFRGLQFPVRQGEPDCQYYLKTGTCAYGMSCKFNHPPPAWRPGGEQYPQRPGQPECQFYLANGTCKFGMTCKFHHPPLPPGQPLSQDSRSSSGSRGNRRSLQGSGEQGQALNDMGYPLRPGEKECAFFLKTGQCKFGTTCKFHHPNVRGTPPADIVPSDNPGLGMTGWPMNLNMPWPMSASAPGFFPLNQPFLGGPPLPFVPGSAPSTPPSYLPGVQASAGVLPLPNANSGNSPQRGGVPECRIYMKTGQCRYGTQCKFSHPPLPLSGTDYPSLPDKAGLEQVPSQFQTELDMKTAPAVQAIVPQAVEENQANQGEVRREAQPLPQQQQQMLREDSAKEHRLNQYLEQQAMPMPRAMPPLGVSVLGLPLRPGAPPCPQYMQFAECRYGVLCPLDHPILTPFQGMPPNALPGMPMPSPLPPGGGGPMAPLEPSSTHRMLLHLPSTLSSSAASLAEMHFDSFKDLKVEESPRLTGPKEDAA